MTTFAGRAGRRSVSAALSVTSVTIDGVWFVLDGELASTRLVGKHQELACVESVPLLSFTAELWRRVLWHCRRYVYTSGRRNMWLGFIFISGVFLLGVRWFFRNPGSCRLDVLRISRRQDFGEGAMNTLESIALEWASVSLGAVLGID